jgi:hypothetical protein
METLLEALGAAGKYNIVVTEDEDGKGPISAYWHEPGWWVYNMSSNNIVQVLPLWQQFDGLRPATLEELSVDMGGVRCWFVEDGNGDYRLYSMGRDGDCDNTSQFCMTCRRDERPIARHIAIQNNAPVIPYKQWQWLQENKA